MFPFVTKTFGKTLSTTETFQWVKNDLTNPGSIVRSQRRAFQKCYLIDSALQVNFFIYLHFSLKNAKTKVLSRPKPSVSMQRVQSGNADPVNTSEIIIVQLRPEKKGFQKQQTLKGCRQTKRPYWPLKRIWFKSPLKVHKITVPFDWEFHQGIKFTVDSPLLAVSAASKWKLRFFVFDKY